jgi:hypothetical protein
MCPHDHHRGAISTVEFWRYHRSYTRLAHSNHNDVASIQAALSQHTIAHFRGTPIAIFGIDLKLPNVSPEKKRHALVGDIVGWVDYNPYCYLTGDMSQTLDVPVRRHFDIVRSV